MSLEKRCKITIIYYNNDREYDLKVCFCIKKSRGEAQMNRRIGNDVDNVFGCKSKYLDLLQIS